MWVSRKEFDKLKDELDAVKREFDSHRKDVVLERNFSVDDGCLRWVFYGPGSNLHQQPGRQDISLKRVVEKIMAHLGMELKYIEGHPACVDLTKKPKAKAA